MNLFKYKSIIKISNNIIYIKYMNQEIKFYDFNKNIYLTTIYINNSSIKIIQNF